jgi:hypothetical protein
MRLLVRPVFLAVRCSGLIGLPAKRLLGPVKIIPFESHTLKE